jgi:hypothetical protein
MSYIGQTLPADTFQGFTTDSFAGDGSATTFTLSKTPFNESALLVVINNVVQKPTTNFTVSGTTLTIVGTAVASGDVIYATHIGGALPIGQAASLDLNGASDQLILDADADTTISADTDDQIDIKIGGTDALRVTGTALTGNALATIGASGTASSIAGITFHRNGDDDGTSIYTADVSGTDNLARSNTGFGMTALDAITTGDNNAVFGYAAATAMTTGVENTAIGRGAMESATTAAYNTCLGKNAGNGLTEGNLYNVLIGNEAGLSITTGSYNIAIGAAALDGFDTEVSNLGIGYRALGGSIAGGEYNVAIGNSSLDALTSADDCVAVGYYAGSAVTEGHRNTFIGSDAGNTVTTGTDNTIVGENAQTGNVAADQQTIVGRGTSGSGTGHQIVMGYNNGSAGDGYITVGQGSGGDKIYNNYTSNATWTKASDERIKKDIVTNTEIGLDFINELRTVKFKKKNHSEVDANLAIYDASDTDARDDIHYGLIAQEVKAAMDKHSIAEFQGWHKLSKEVSPDEIQGVSEQMFVYPLIKAVQELAAKVKALEDA